MVSWTCDICGEQIGVGSGCIDFHNGNPKLGRVGAEPRESRDAQEFSGGGRDALMSHMKEAINKPANVHVSVHHYACNAQSENLIEGYWIGVERLQSFGNFVAWMRHLSAKRWFGKAECIRFVEIWGAHAEGVRGYNPMP
jgi:hypothetical protein